MDLLLSTVAESEAKDDAGSDDRSIFLLIIDSDYSAFFLFYFTELILSHCYST